MFKNCFLITFLLLVVILSQKASEKLDSPSFQGLEKPITAIFKGNFCPMLVLCANRQEQQIKDFYAKIKLPPLFVKILFSFLLLDLSFSGSTKKHFKVISTHLKYFINDPKIALLASRAHPPTKTP